MPSQTGDGTPGAERAQPVLSTIVIALPAVEIALFKAIIESYDNLATLRTEDPVRHHLTLNFAPAARGEVEELLEALSRQFGVVRLGAR